MNYIVKFAELGRGNHKYPEGYDVKVLITNEAKTESDFQFLSECSEDVKKIIKDMFKGPKMYVSRAETNNPDFWGTEVKKVNPGDKNYVISAAYGHDIYWPIGKIETLNEETE